MSDIGKAREAARKLAREAQRERARALYQVRERRRVALVRLGLVELDRESWQRPRDWKTQA